MSGFPPFDELAERIGALLDANPELAAALER